MQLNHNTIYEIEGVFQITTTINLSIVRLKVVGE
jgi:hypothetical protein